MRVLLERYCFECHSGDEAEGEIDLESFETMEDVRRAPGIWLQVREILESRQMPPRKAKQPTEEELILLQRWVESYLRREAEAQAGDPGPLVLRRLNNAEYNYTVRDLTGVPSLDPTREFPVDGAAGEGFKSFERLLKQHSSFFTTEEMRLLTNFVCQTLFKHFQLYQFSLFGRRDDNTQKFIFFLAIQLSDFGLSSFL